MDEASKCWCIPGFSSCVIMRMAVLVLSKISQHLPIAMKFVTDTCVFSGLSEITHLNPMALHLVPPSVQDFNLSNSLHL